MDLQLSGKVVVITGGTTGIGRECAKTFWQEGCKVAVCGRSAEKIQAFKAEMDALGASYICESVDVLSQKALEEFANHVANAYGRIDIWLNNAGGNIHKPLSQITEEDFDYIMDVNFKSCFFGTNIAAKHMQQTGGGVILNTSSISAFMPTAGRSLYGAAKLAVANLTKTAAAEYAAYNIRVNSVMPGLVKTALTEKIIASMKDMSPIPMRRAGEVAEAAKPMVFLCSPAASYITGANLEMSGGRYIVSNPSYSWEQKTP